MPKRKVVKRRKSSPVSRKKPLISLKALYTVFVLAILLVVLVLIRAYLASL
jgi:hypothetical protein